MARDPPQDHFSSSGSGGDDYDDDDDAYESETPEPPTPPRRTTTPVRRRNGQFASSRTTPPSRVSRGGNIVSPLRRRTDSRGLKSAPTPPSPINVATSPRSSRRRPRKEPSPPPSSASVAGELVLSSAGFVKDVLAYVLWLVRKPLVIILALWTLYVLLGLAYVWAKNTAIDALMPLCGLPGVSLMGFSMCDRWSIGETRGMWSPDAGGFGDFPKLMDLQSHFESVLDSRVVGSVMVHDLKNSEIAVRDLNTLVRHSNLQCKDELSSALNDFITTVKTTSRQLSRFGSKVGGVVDKFLAVDAYAIRTLKGIQEAQAEADKSSVGLTAFLLWPFQERYDAAAAEREVLSTFLKSASVMDTSIQQLIREAETALQGLEELENNLETVENIVHQERGDLIERRKEALAQIWTYLGGNRNKLAVYESHLYLLKNTGVFKKRALSFVTKSLVQLQTMQSNLMELRERVAEPGLVGEVEMQIPLEVHIDSIRKGVERLSDSMSRAKNLQDSYNKMVTDAYDVVIDKLKRGGTAESVASHEEAIKKLVAGRPNTLGG